MFNKIDENDLMIKGSEGMAAAQSNLELAFAIIIAISIIFGYWLGSRPAPQADEGRQKELAFVLLFTIFAGTVMALPGGVFLVMMMAVSAGISYWVGHRRIHKED